ncbi:MAG: anaerobic ribonucleoside-triphosphate reductase activating protein [Lachnospiraceae bacterium]|nr:anaerobic ribonucleoside-triphosphate reductase activating protein [Lachnospiraceae bacterium]
MRILGLTKTTLLDYPGRVAAAVFVGSCNFRCPFCHNGNLVLHSESFPEITQEELFSFLEKRRGILSGVCITGGEPTLYDDLPELIQKIRSLGYAVKLDTNGYRPQVLSSLLERNLLNYVAMDIKSDREHYADTAGLENLDFSRIEESVNILKTCSIPYEFRTTVVKGLHTSCIFENIGKWLMGDSHYFLQSYQESDAVICKRFSSFSKEELEQFCSLVKCRVPNTFLRGVE